MFWGELSSPPGVASGRTGEEGPHPSHNKLKTIVVNVVFYLLSVFNQGCVFYFLFHLHNISVMSGW